uniref:Uncharacterized protein n=1 Tax=Salix viminalis TaxID=40686 RepID=A0A6N2N920_SALVM
MHRTSQFLHTSSNRAQIVMLNLHPFLDSKNMKPGDKLFDNINGAIRKCKPRNFEQWTMENVQWRYTEFNWALEEAKNWSDVVTSTSDNIIKTLIEMEGEKKMQRHKSTPILINATAELMKCQGNHITKSCEVKLVKHQ